MKRFIVLCLMILYLLIAVSFATQEETYNINSGENNNIESSLDVKKEKIYSGEMENKTSGEKSTKMQEEGVGVDNNKSEENFKVETPTIILLILFGVLVIVSFVLIIFKI